MMLAVIKRQLRRDHLTPPLYWGFELSEVVPEPLNDANRDNASAAGPFDTPSTAVSSYRE
jgi:hypothetical protein